MQETVAIVTGAARGIGLATTEVLSERGMRVVMVDRDGTALSDAAAGRQNVLALTHDVSDPDAVAAMIRDTLDWAGRLDVLINNAGVAEFGPIEETDFATWRRVMATNLDGVFLCVQAATEALRATGGRV